MPIAGIGPSIGPTAVEWERGYGVRPLTLSVRRPLRSLASIALLAILVVLSVPGCTWNEKIKLASNGAPEYQNLQISYDLASAPEIRHLDPPSSVERTSHVELASNEATPQSARPWSRRRVHLELQYPFPGVHPSFARATLRIVTDTKKRQEEKPFAWGLPEGFQGSSVTYSQHSPSGMSAAKPKKPEPTEPAPLSAEDQDDLISTEEVLYIDLPKAELDEVLTELAKADFFKAPSNPDAEAHLVVTFNKGQCEKVWAREDHLDRLVELLRQHGAPLSAPSVEPKKT
jgi:hypothetical protein